MCWSATLAMLVSSTSMNVASVTTSAIAHGLCPGWKPSSAIVPSQSSVTFGSTDMPGRRRS